MQPVVEVTEAAVQGENNAERAAFPGRAKVCIPVFRFLPLFTPNPTNGGTDESMGNDNNPSSPASL